MNELVANPYLVKWKGGFICICKLPKTCILYLVGSIYISSRNLAVASWFMEICWPTAFSQFNSDTNGVFS